MKISTFNNRTKSTTKNSNAYKNALNLMTSGKRVYTCHTSGKGRFTTNIDSTVDTITVLTLAGLKKVIDFTFDNDSPRGGKTGNYVELTTKGKRKMIK